MEAALANPSRNIRQLYLTDNAERRLAEALASRAQLAHERVLPTDLDRRLGPDTVHQGALLETEPLPEPTLAELAERAAGRPLIVLDQVTDPHNVGAILRSAAVFGAAGLVMTRRHSPPLDGALAKSASGALEHVPVALVQNLARALAELKELGCIVLGLDETPPSALEDGRWPARVGAGAGRGGQGPARADARQLRPARAHRHRRRRSPASTSRTPPPSPCTWPPCSGSACAAVILSAPALSRRWSGASSGIAAAADGLAVAVGPAAAPDPVALPRTAIAAGARL